MEEIILCKNYGCSNLVKTKNWRCFMCTKSNINTSKCQNSLCDGKTTVFLCEECKSKTCCFIPISIGWRKGVNTCEGIESTARLAMSLPYLLALSNWSPSPLGWGDTSPMAPLLKITGAPKRASAVTRVKCTQSLESSRLLLPMAVVWAAKLMRVPILAPSDTPMASKTFKTEIRDSELLADNPFQLQRKGGCLTVISVSV